MGQTAGSACIIGCMAAVPRTWHWPARQPANAMRAAIHQLPACPDMQAWPGSTRNPGLATRFRDPAPGGPAFVIEIEHGAGLCPLRRL